MSEYDFDITKEQTFSKFITQYNDGVYWSGVTDLSYAANQDKKHYVLVSSVDGET